MKRQMWIVSLAVTVVVVAIVGAGCGSESAPGTRYHCPMHPTYVSDRPGDCPICGMRLVPIETQVAPTKVPAYVCPMHPEVTSDRPGRCPKCGMDLVPTGEPTPGEGAGGPGAGPVAPAAGGGAGERRVLYYRSPMDPSVTSPSPATDSMGMAFVPVYADQQDTGMGAVPGYAPVVLSGEGVRLAGVQTAPAVRERISRSVRTVGMVVPDETRIRHVHTKIPGWVETLAVNFTGQVVHAGQPILAIYSPELVSSQEEYLRVRETAARFAESSLPEVRRGADDLVTASRRRLELFDVPEGFIEELERRGSPRRDVTLLAPVSGYVTAKDVFEGHRVEPGMELFTVTDLSRVWVEADFYEYEAQVLRLGERATVQSPYDPAGRHEGRIAYVYPTLDPATRTLRVRFDFANPGLTLKPGMFVNVELTPQGVDGIVVADSAVMDTGERQVVFVRQEDGSFVPRQVTVGVRDGGRAQLLSGVAEGEQVVVRANFLLDSESRLRSAIAGTRPGGTP